MTAAAPFPRSPSDASRRPRPGFLALALAGVLGLTSACGAGSAGAAGQAAPASPTSSPTPAATAPTVEELAAALPAPELAPAVDVLAVTAAAVPQTALATAALLEVKGRAPRTGYDRDLFGSGWVDVDRNGCDTRNDVLARDLEPQTSKPGTRDCVVLTGTLADPYSGRTIEFVRGNATSTAVQVDHVVALSDAWQKGAQQWDEATRTRFANDPMNLLAVDGPLNAQKGDGDTATWLPPNKPFRCAYVARQVGVKYTYGLWVTEAERAAMVSVLSACPDQPLPEGSTVPPPPAPAEPSPAPLAPVVEQPVAPPVAQAPVGATPVVPLPVVPAPPAPEPPPAAAPAPAVAYKNCDAARAAGAAPVRVGDPGYGKHLDRDGDGVGCES
ncbi:GmrSD restriction endonuclease domain-containing protein [Cellulomonas sp. NS3]|uniref:GmrSD restriction endonuclease domain-containing protein n=1 Tax=Cellulomonas sp. NS3 TaxID=2973977 RepID=UPI00216250C8|nr:DUF1524 domain-containing protein [Cellulomonas sp. NS3]